jgi:hypothetical protein
MVWGVGASAVRLGIAPNHVFFARGINSQNVVVGRSNVMIEGTGAYAWQYPGDSAANFRALPPPSNFRYLLAVGINEQGDVLGAAEHELTGVTNAVIWRGSVPTLVPSISGIFELEQITDTGDILGRKGGRGFLWNSGSGFQYLPSGNFAGDSRPWRANRNGELIGRIGDRSVLWQLSGGTASSPVDLAAQIDDPDLALGAYYAINDYGEIGGSFDAALETYPVILSPIAQPSLAVDLDRDGEIEPASASGDDETSVDRPYRFWINDDDDDGELKRSPTDDVPRLPDDDGRDSANATVDGLRDLEDFVPVYFDISALLEKLPPGEFTYRLRHATGALAAVFTNLTRQSAREGVRGTIGGLTSGFGPHLDQPLGSATVCEISADGVDLFAAAPDFMELTRSGQGGVVLMEARHATNDPLVLDVERDGQVFLRLRLHLCIAPVEAMFSYVNLRAKAHGNPIAEGVRGPNYGIDDPEPPSQDPFVSEPSRRNLVFVHGYNVNGNVGRGWAASIFKRFYWSGSKDRFYAVLWRGDDGQGDGIIPSNITPDYHRNVGHAWQQGLHFRDFLESLAGDTAIVAHSLGNVVTMTALCYARDAMEPGYLRRAALPGSVRRYFALNAAAPTEAVATDSIDPADVSLMRHRLWKNYERRLWPTDWFRLFDQENDARSRLTWRDAFGGIEICTNFFSSEEEILANPTNDDTPILEPIREGGLLSWVAQEKIKGGLGVGALPLRSVTAGWSLNQEWYEESAGMLLPLSATQATEQRVATSRLPERPFFRRFQSLESGGFYPGYEGERLMAPLQDEEARDEAEKTVTVAKCLAEGIPAISFAMGRNRVIKFDAFVGAGNFDLNDTYSAAAGTGFRNGWITRRKDGWLHSDCVEVALLYVHPLFDRIVQRLNSPAPTQP